MESGIPPAEDLDAFHALLKDAIDKDDETKQIKLMMLVGLVLIVLFIAAIVIFTVLKTYKGTFIYSGPPGPPVCAQGAWVVTGPVCSYVPCAVMQDGKLAQGFFATYNDCMNSITPNFYPVQGSSNGINYATCSTYQGTVPSNWSTISSNTVYTGTSAQQLCQTDAASYNATVAKLGVECDATKGPQLCAPADGVTCVQNPQILYNPNDFTGSQCLEWKACDTSSNSCAQQYGPQPNFGDGYTNPIPGTCGVGQDPCAVCPNTCYTYDASKQAAALPGPGGELQPGSGDSVTYQVSPTCTPGNCTSPYDCCNQIAKALALPYSLYPSDTTCHQSDGSFSCLADAAVAQGICDKTDGTSQCYQLASTQQPGGLSTWSCAPYNSSMGANNVAFTQLVGSQNQVGCYYVAAQLNTGYVGLECDSAQGVITCDSTKGAAGCTSIQSIIQGNSDVADLAYNPTPYLSFQGQNPAKNAQSPACVLRTTDDCTTDCSPTCSFSQQDTGTTECSQCQCSTGACTQTGWSCAADPNQGAVCTLTGATGTTIQDACKALGPNIASCGCSCILPNQQCINNTVVGRPCDPLYPDASGAMVPLSYACPTGIMQSAQTLDTSTMMCVNSVPQATPGFSVYNAPTQTPTPACPYNAASAGFSLADQPGPNTLYFVNDPNATQQQMVYPCPLSVYEACHGDNPILPAQQGQPSCTYGSFSGQTILGGFLPSSAMCAMSVVDMGESENANVPVCVSYVTSNGNTDVVLSGCVDAGAPGSLYGSPIPDTGMPGNSCGTCSNTGKMTTAAYMCPMAPTAAGFTTIQNASGSFCDTLTNWSSYLYTNPSSIPNAAAINSSIQGTKTNATVLVPSLYAGLYGELTGTLPFTNSINCPTAPAMQGDMLGYCSSSSSTLAQGYCNNYVALAVCPY